MTTVTPLEPPRNQLCVRLHRKRVLFLGTPIAVVLAIVWAGSNRTPVDATQPIVVRGTIPELRKTVPSTAETGRRFRIGTFNIHGGRGPDGTTDLNATAELLRKSRLDFVGLYEVHGGYTTDQAEILGETLDLASVFAGTEYRWWRNHFGNGLLIGRPIGQVIPIPLPGTQPKRFRNALLTTVHIGSSSVRVLATHIDTEVDRDRQLAVVFDLFQSLEMPAVLMGDLNCEVQHPPLARLIAEPDVQDAVATIGLAARRPKAIDHLLVRGLKVVDAGEIETNVSDHPLIWAELEVP